MELFKIQNLTFTYPEQEMAVLRDVSMTLRQGDFAVLAGPSGCGKSTMLRQLKTVLAPHGKKEGEILYNGIPLDEVDNRTQAAKIGFVLQDPDSQIVTDKVWHELAFGLESLGVDNAAIRGRVAEMASFFGIQTWFHRSVTQLSGGQKQLLNLASIMVLQPDILILDEPTSQLDPIAATDFLQTLGRINRELGTTILICEHRLEDVIPMASRLLILDGGVLIADDTPEGTFEILRRQSHPMLHSMPTPMRIWSSLNWNTPCPMTVSDGRSQLTAWADAHTLGNVPERTARTHAEDPCMTLDEVWFRYERESPDILKSVSMKAYPGELLCILGGNGTGKSTTLSVLSGVRRPYRGKMTCRTKKVAALPQNPQMLLVKKNVREELLSVFPGKKLHEVADRIGEMVALCRLEGLLDRHPYDLSGGEQQRTALAKVLLQEPEILLLDEPTKGVDNDFKLTFAQILKELTNRGVCVIMVSHDVEFCAQYADRCGLFFDGGIVTMDAPQPFFAGKSFYTTAANRMARHRLPNAVTAADVILACGGKVPESEMPPYRQKVNLEPPQERKPEKLPKWRRILGFITGSVFFGLLLYTSLALDLSGLYQGGNFIGQYSWIYAVMFMSFGIFAACISRKSSLREQRLMKGKLSNRTKATILLSVLLIPLTIWGGLKIDGGRKYMLISFAIIFETMLPFFLIFEGRKPQARELVILSVLSALAIGGRAVFFALPGFKPVAAMVILTGVAFGAEAGFMVGAMTMFCSNVLFGQGPWTPWQMFAMGMMGLLAGVLFRKGILHRERFSLSVFGGLVTFLIYGGVMNPASILMYQPNPDWQMILTACITGVPADAIHALATVMFLWFLSEPMLEKLDRVKVKYGLMENGEQHG
ncbi:MAG: ATP-binding cassette domain-containing protein [Oscillospiraceae bacterium]|nr:ATP-binding cassette domain-containing protein [Oscillospiraceae bacterium]